MARPIHEIMAESSAGLARQNARKKQDMADRRSYGLGNLKARMSPNLGNTAGRQRFTPSLTPSGAVDRTGRPTLPPEMYEGYEPFLTGPANDAKSMFKNMITLPGGSPDQEFFDTYGTPMRGNIEYDSMAYPGEKIYGLGDRLTRNIMLDSNNLRNYELGKTPIINPDTNLPYGYELEGPDEDRWMTPEDSLGGSRPMTDASGWKPFWDYITGGLFKNRGGIASLRR